MKEVLGVDAENVTLGWRFPGASSPEEDLLNLTGEIVNNGKAGLLDVDLVQQQKVLSCYAGTYGMADYNAFVMSGRPKQGQTLDDVKNLFLAEIEKLKKGGSAAQFFACFVAMDEFLGKSRYEQAYE